jgi:hypothetical protein
MYAYSQVVWPFLCVIGMRIISDNHC